MPGRLVLHSDQEVLAQELAIVDFAAPVESRFNMAPPRPIPVVVRGSTGNRLVSMRWGLLPPWTRDPALGPKLINARAESVATKSAFKRAFRERRCLVPVDGFYEWKKGGGGKQPFYLHPAEPRPVSFAGLWESWEHPDGSLILSVALLTCAPNATVAPLHERMPVLIRPDDRELWTDPRQQDPAAIQPLCAPYEWEGWLWHRVGRRVNSPDNEGLELIERQGGGAPQSTLFG